MLLPLVLWAVCGCRALQIWLNGGGTGAQQRLVSFIDHLLEKIIHYCNISFLPHQSVSYMKAISN